jgi:iron(III) transport system ATP-binding protein
MQALNQVSLEARHISLSYGSTEVLRDVNLRVEPGEFFALLGPSGSGKSTLLRLIAGFNQHQRGELLVDGKDITGVPPHARNVGMVFQNYALWPHMTVWDNVAFGLVERREPRDVIRRKVTDVLALVGLSDYAKRRPAQLSGGQQQRVALARTVVIEPKLLLLDEPLSNLDKQLRVQMREELKNLQRKLGLTTIFVTHDQEEAMTTADRMAVLDKGVLQQVGSASGLYDYPVNRFVAGFVGTANVLEGRVTAVTGDTLTFDAQGLGELHLPRPADAPAPGAAALAFRPHQVDMRVPGESADASRLWVDGVVESAEFLGESSRYRVRTGDAVLIADQPHYAGVPLFATGARVCLGIEPGQVRYLTD